MNDTAPKLTAEGEGACKCDAACDAAQCDLANGAATRAVMARFGLRTKHRLGQHFLIDRKVLDRVVELAALQEGAPVIEVGPGIGTLTQALLRNGAQVFAIEHDETLLPALRYTCARWDEALHVIVGDALALAPNGLQREIRASDPSQTALSLVSNLPYNIAATLVLKYFDEMYQLASMTVMVQREVAERMAAQPGTKNYGAYTVKLALRAEIGDSFRVSPASFMPPPHVDSAVIRLDRRESEETPEEVIALASLFADAAFAQRRKTIANSMRGFLKGRSGIAATVVDYLPEIFEAVGVTPDTRGEALPPKTYLAMGAYAHDRWKPRGTKESGSS